MTYTCLNILFTATGGCFILFTLLLKKAILEGDTVKDDILAH